MIPAGRLLCRTANALHWARRRRLVHRPRPLLIAIAMPALVHLAAVVVPVTLQVTT